MSENISPISNCSTNTSLSDNSIYINENLTQKIVLILEGVIKLNKNKYKKNKSVFNCDKIPNISLYNYLYRIQKYSQIEDNTLILALIYIDRICSNGDFMINYYNIHKILFVAVVLAIKYNEDNYFTNNYYSKIGGITSKELEFLELNFSSSIDFKFYVCESLFEKYCKYINNNEYNFKTFNERNSI